MRCANTEALNSMLRDEERLEKSQTEFECYISAELETITEQIDLIKKIAKNYGDYDHSGYANSLISDLL